MVVIIPNPIVKCGQLANDCETISNVRRLMWQPVPGTYVPQLVLNTAIPVGWHKPHKWLKGELHVVSEAYHAFFHNGSTNATYIVPSGNNVEFPYFEAYAQDGNDPSKQWKYTFTGVVPVDYIGTFVISQEIVHVYPFIAKYVTTTPPS